jgi:Tfp pilus assembly PilM family ATPase
LKERAEALVASFYTQICLETQRSLDAFFLMFRKEKIHHLFLCGGGATMLGLSAAMSRNLALETSVLDPRKKFGETAPLSHLFDAALGLALY